MPSSTSTKTQKRTRNRTLTDASIRALKPGRWLTETWGYGEGALQVRRTGRGVRYYYRYGPKQERISIPTLNADGQPMKLAEARTEARKLSARYQAGERDLKAVIRAEQREAARAREEAEKAAQAS